jgi:chemotaxis signal transduction protein
MSEGVGAAPEDGDVNGDVGRRSRIEFVRVLMAGESCVLELGRVERLVVDPEIARVPRSSPVIAGVTAAGGDIAPVVEGRTLLGLPARPPEEAPTLLLLDREDADRAAGLLVDEVVGIETHDVGRVTPIAESGDWEPGVDRRWYLAVVTRDTDDRPTGVLDLRTVLEAAAERSHSP